MSLRPLPRGPVRRVVYLGTPAPAVEPLERLVAAGFDVALVVTRADARRGRGGAITPSPVKAAAQRLGLAVSHTTADATGVGAELGVVVAYGEIIRPAVLAELPMVNLHFSLLPRWRGAAPVERAILAGDAETGVCLMQVAEGLDTGDVLARAVVPIGQERTAEELRAELVDVGARMLVTQLRAGLGAAEPQVGEPTYAAKISPADRVLDLAAPVAEAHRRVRIGGATTTFRGKRLKVLAASVVPAATGAPPGALVEGVVACADGGLALEVVQPEGRPPMAWRDFANGHRPRPGELLGT